MGFQSPSLAKLLRVLGASPNQQSTILKRDAYDTVRKVLSPGDRGGFNFYLPNHADFREHITGGRSLYTTTAQRLIDIGSAKNIYPNLRDGELTFWNSFRRSINGPVRALQPPTGVLTLGGAGQVRIEHLIYLEYPDSHGTQRLALCMYPFPWPVLRPGIARMGLAALERVVGKRVQGDIAILDAHRADLFRLSDQRFDGEEADRLWREYQWLLRDWQGMVDKRRAA